MRPLKLPVLFLIVLLSVSCTSKKDEPAVTPDTTKKALEEVVEVPPTPPQPQPVRITVMGLGLVPAAGKAPSPGQGKMMARRAAQLDANRKLQDLLTATPYNYSKEKAAQIAQNSVSNFEYQEAGDNKIMCKLEVEFLP